MFTTNSIISNNVVASIFQPGARSSGAQVQQQLLTVLQDEQQQLLSTLELNQWATLTYHEGQHSAGGDDLVTVLCETLKQVLTKPVAYSPLAMQKALAVAKAIVLLGADRVYLEARMLGPVCLALKENYNTALLAQQQTGATGFWLRLKGGSVDEGGPVREAATKLYELLSNQLQWQHERAQAADPQSLVPVGSSQQVAFCTDAVRLRALQQQIQQQTALKSNLAKASDGWGSGYTSKDGKTVVGAAHSLDEMLKHAQRKEQQFTDDAAAAKKTNNRLAGEEAVFSEYSAPNLLLAANNNTQAGMPSSTATGDLLGAPPPTAAAADLLSLSTEQPQQEPDLLSLSPTAAPHPSLQQQPAAADPDLLAFAMSPSTTTTSAAAVPQQQQQQQNDLLSLAGGGAAPPVATQEPQSNNNLLLDPLGGNTPTITAASMNHQMGNNGLLLDQPAQSSPQQRTLPMTNRGLMVGPAPPNDPFASLGATTMTNGTISTTTTAPNSTNTAAQSLSSSLMGMTASSTTATTSMPVGMKQQQQQGKDLYSAFDSLNILSATSAPAPVAPSLSTLQQFGAAVQQQPHHQQPQQRAMGGGLMVSSMTTAAGPSGGNDDDDNGFVMGGAVGSGLEPVGNAPAAPPPPPPPSSSFY